MADHKDEEQLSRREAAERLTDLAYALTSGGPLEMRIGGQPVKLPLGKELVLKRESRSNDDRTELELELSWSTATTPPLLPPESHQR